MRGLYIHIPFCRKICPYCDFYKMVASASFQERYIQYLLKEMDIALSTDYNIQTVYIGGGTPSILSVNVLEKLFAALNEKIPLSQLKEFTIEVNPEDITYHFVELLKKYHITRVSIGVQTFIPRLQALIGRFTEYDDLLEKIQLLRVANIQNINLDLMYGFENQTLTELAADLQRFIDCKPTHLATYSLILEEHTIFYHQKRENYPFISEELDRQMYDYIVNFLQTNHYLSYETSNFAIVGYQSKHNLIYWSNDEYVCLGAGASCYNQGYRCKTTTNLKRYYEGLDHGEIIYDEYIWIDKSTKMEEEVMLGFRKSEGISLERFVEKFAISFFEQFPHATSMIQNGLLEIADQYVRIPSIHHYIANYIIVKLLY